MRLLLVLLLLAAVLSQHFRPERVDPDLRRQQHLDTMTMRLRLPNTF
jgi:hypothetical protein